MTNQNNASFDPIFPSSSSPPPPLPPPPVSSLPNPNHHRKKRTKLNKALLEPTPIPPPILGNLVSFPLPVGSSSSSSMPTKNAAETGSVKKNKGGGGGGGGGRKLDPSAPKITKPCTECGKKFSSWKALFGHMRCHPERDWRGINPPPNHRRRPPPPLTKSSCPPSSPPPHLHRTHIGDPQSLTLVMTAEDHEVADCLLFLANYAAAVRHQSPVERNWENRAPFVGEELCGAIIPFHHHNQEGEDSGRFECSSCKKVFGSFQALGGHRASHKNVKGCFQNDTVFPEDFRQSGCLPGSSSIGGGGYDAGQPTEFVAAGLDGGNHKCSICLKVFPSGQALGGHKRCHWDNQRGNQHQQYQQGSQSSSSMLMVDLNLPAPGVIPPAKEEEEHEYSSSPVSRALGPALDLRLGL